MIGPPGTDETTRQGVRAPRARSAGLRVRAGASGSVRSARRKELPHLPTLPVRDWLYRSVTGETGTAP
jgi:hypothetical protein